MLIQEEFKKLSNYNEEVLNFFTDALTKDQYKEVTIKSILESYGLNLNTYLVPEEFEILLQLFPKTMGRITNGCKPSYLPKWLKVNKCLKRKEKCNKHDFCYWISWPRKASDKLFIQGMNEVCKGFWEKFKNYRFYYAVRSFGQTAFCDESKTLDDFFRLGA